MKAKAFTSAQRHVIRWAAEECKRQRSGEMSVAWMLDAWEYALAFQNRSVTEGDILALGALVEPEVNANGYRRCGVRVGSDVKGPWQNVPRQMGLLAEAQDRLTPDEWYKAYEEVHPFRDGNGRTGSILWNWLGSTLDAPCVPPDFWTTTVPDPDEVWAAMRAAETGWAEYRTQKGTTL